MSSGLRLFHGTTVRLADEIARDGLLAAPDRPLALSETRDLAMEDVEGAAALAHLRGEPERGVLLEVQVGADQLEPDHCRRTLTTGAFLLRTPVAAGAVIERETVSFERGPFGAIARSTALAEYLARQNARREGRWVEVTPAVAAALIAEIRDLHRPVRESAVAERVTAVADARDRLRTSIHDLRASWAQSFS